MQTPRGRPRRTSNRMAYLTPVLLPDSRAPTSSSFHDQDVHTGTILQALGTPCLSGTIDLLGWPRRAGPAPRDTLENL